MNIDPLMWFVLSEMDTDDEERERERDSSENHWQDSNEDSDTGDDEY